MDPIRIVAHVDLDAFFASVEQYDHPEYRNKPVIVGADPKNGKGRGVVATCSYEARKFGIHSAMPISQAWKLCPQGIYVHSHFGRYEQISEQVMNILQNWGTAFQQGGIDEAYIELTDKFSSFSDGEVTAREIQDRILNEIGISASIGIAPNKSLAKIA
jgi:nucleotidyltransferase/DNA polymerase involved in DNA repair